MFVCSSDHTETYKRRTNRHSNDVSGPSLGKKGLARHWNRTRHKPYLDRNINHLVDFFPVTLREVHVLRIVGKILKFYAVFNTTIIIIIIVIYIKSFYCRAPITNLDRYYIYLGIQPH